MAFSDASFEHLPLPAKRRIDAVCERFERAWREGRPRLESYLALVSEDEQDILLAELLHIEIEFRRKKGEVPQAEEYLTRFPAHPDVVQSVFPPPPLPTVDGLPNDTTRPSSHGDGHPPTVPGYEVKEELGRGGMGVVYKARHVRLNRMVALKFILAGPNAPERHQERFRHEAELVAQLRHPHITQIYDIGEAGGQLYLALEYAEGGTLRDRLDGRPLEPRAAVLLLEPLTRAVQHAHRRGIVHRDIKPGNVLLAVGGDSISASERMPSDWQPFPNLPEESNLPPLATCTPKLTDFGLARHLHPEPPRGEPNLAVGTPSYMAPEQAMGEEPGPAVDIWALGATLYELLTGRPPFQAATSPETLREVLLLEPKPPSSLQPKVPHDLDYITLKCLQKEPERRYAGARELAQDLRRYLAGEPIHSPQQRLLAGVLEWSKRRPRLAIGLAVVALLLLFALAGLIGALIQAWL